jgi:3-oxoacyl-(acyl-carrier-protein) synthase
MNNKVYITGSGMATSIGYGVLENWNSIRSNYTGIQLVKSEYSDKFSLVAKMEHPHNQDKLYDISKLALAESILSANLTPDEVEDSAFLFSHGSPDNEYITSQFLKLQSKGKVHPNTVYRTMNNYVCAKLASEFSIKGSVIANAAACAGSAQTIHLGYLLVKYGVVDRCICGGGDIISNLTLEAFRSMRFVLSNSSDFDAIQPFGEHRNGIGLGEGAGFIVLENAKCLDRMGVEEVIQITNSSLANEPASRYGEMESPDAWSNIIKSTIADSQVDLVVAHATSTVKGDLLEAQGIYNSLPNSLTTSLKYYFGHTLSASSVLDIIMLKNMMNRNLSLGSGDHYKIDDKITKLNLLQATGAYEVKSAIKLSAGFGGSISCISLSSEL